MKRNLFKGVFLFLLMFCVSITNIIAIESFPSSIGTIGSKYLLGLSGGSTGVSVTAGDYETTPYKVYSTNSAVICISKVSDLIPVGETCNATTWDNKTAMGVAYIINLINGAGGKEELDHAHYYWTQFLVHSYLGENPTNARMNSDIVTSSSYKILNTNKTWSQIISEAKSYASTADKIITATPNIVLYPDSSGNYIGKLYVSYNNELLNLNTPTINNSKFTLTEGKSDDSGTYYTVSLKDEDISAGSTETFEASFSLTHYISKKYVCGGENNQNLTISQTKPETQDIVITGSVSKPEILTKTQFSKIDATNGKELPGATLQVLDSNKKPILDAEDNELYKWVSTDTPFTIEGLPAGTYYLKEIIAPEGYTTTEELVEFTVKSDGTVTKVVMKNSPIVEVENTGSLISKILIGTGAVLLVAGVGILIYVLKKNKISK